MYIYTYMHIYIYMYTHTYIYIRHLFVPDLLEQKVGEGGGEAAREGAAEKDEELNTAALEKRKGNTS